MILAQFQSVGHNLFRQGLVSSHSGNLSVRLGERLFITHRNSMLGCLVECDVIETGVTKNDRATPLASTELVVHRSIYQETPTLAVVHAHPPYAVVLSFLENEITPCDREGALLLEKVPVLERKVGISYSEFAHLIGQELKYHKVILVRAHGSFAAGQLLEEAYHYTTVLEESCRIIYLLKALGMNPSRQDC